MMMMNKYKHDKSGFPILYSTEDECCGCTACKSICRMNAISMETDEHGFMYPFIDRLKCIKCYQCLMVCPIKSADDENIIVGSYK